MYEILALAALLHDIGKVGQRAHDKSDGLSEPTRKLADYLCPKNMDGVRTHLHVLYTNEFVDKIKENIPKGINISDLANLAAYHHNPADELQKIIAEADHLSSAMEREDAVAELPGGKDFRKIPLNAIMASVDSVSDQSEKKSETLNLVKYSPESIFPVKPDASMCSPSQYKKIWDELLSTTTSISCNEPLKFINTLLSVFEKYLWAVPSATNVPDPNVSLFDHMKTTSALAGSMYLSKNQNAPFVLAAGNLGGIQKFIFGARPGSGGIAKALRGRSFKVGALSDSAAIGILHKLGLTLAHLIITAGGKFVLILPNNPETHDTLAKCKRTYHDWILTETAGELRFQMVWKEYGREIRDFSAIQKDLEERLTESSYKGLEPLLDGRGWKEEDWLRPGFTEEHKDVCRSCFVRISEPGRDLCSSCQYDREDGRNIVNASHMSLSFGDNPGKRLPLAEYSLESKITAADEAADLLIEFRGRIPDKINFPYFTFLKNNYVPRDQHGDILEFGEIARAAEGNQILGYLKADVDNLGFVFNKAVSGHGRPSIARYATFSRSLEYFFSGYLYHLIEKEFPDTYTVFSGGDDLFFIGPWDNIFRLAAKIRNDFGRFTCGSKSWGLSAGIATSKPRSPLNYGLSEANRYLAMSKNIPGKDNITAFGTTMMWAEFDRALDQGDRLAGWLNDGVLNSARVYRLLYYGEQLVQFHKTKNASFLQVIPLMIYDMARNWKEGSDAERQAKAWVHPFINPEYPEACLLPFICQYALNKIRS